MGSIPITSRSLTATVFKVATRSARTHVRPNHAASRIELSGGTGKKTGKNPTDRGKLGVKRSTLVDGRGVPLAVAVAGANVPDGKLVAETLEAIPTERPEPTPQEPQHLCLDKGYAGAPVDGEVRERGGTQPRQTEPTQNVCADERSFTPSAITSAAFSNNRKGFAKRRLSSSRPATSLARVLLKSHRDTS